MALACKIYSDPKDIDPRLAEIGMTREILDQARRSGLLARREHTENHPLTAAGFNQWSETVRTLRDLSGPGAWIPDNDANQGLLTNPTLQISIAVVPGDSKTGREGSTPSTRSRRGPKTADAIRANGTGYLFKEIEDDLVALEASRRDGLWLLLVFVNQQKQWAQSELSRPTQMSAGNRPNAWSERILLPDIDFSDGPGASRRTDLPPVEKSPEIVIEVKRRA